MINVIRLFARGSARTAPATMHDADRAIIRAFAAGDSTRRDEAIAIHRQHIPTLGVRGTPEMRFMAEVDNPSPDLGLRAAYRQEVLAQA